MMYKNRNKKGMLVIVMLFLLISIGFATLRTTLNINGTTKIMGNTWDIHFENVDVLNGSVSADVPEIIDNTTVSYEI